MNKTTFYQIAQEKIPSITDVEIEKLVHESVKKFMKELGPEFYTFRIDSDHGILAFRNHKNLRDRKKVYSWYMMYDTLLNDENIKVLKDKYSKKVVA